MEHWTPQDWVVFIGAIGTTLVTVIGSLAGLGKLYIDYLKKRDREELVEMRKDLKELTSKYDQLQGRYDAQREDLIKAQTRIAILEGVLRLHNIEVPAT